MHSSPSASSLSASTADAGSSHTFNGYSDESGEEKHAKRESDAGTGSDADAWVSGMGSASERSQDARSPAKKIRLSADADPHESRAHN